MKLRGSFKDGRKTLTIYRTARSRPVNFTCKKKQFTKKSREAVLFFYIFTASDEREKKGIYLFPLVKLWDSVEIRPRPL